MIFRRFTSIFLGLLILGAVGFVITELAVSDRHSEFNGTDKTAAQKLLRQAYLCVDAPLIEPFVQKYVVVSVRVEEAEIRNFAKQNMEGGDTNAYPALAVDPGSGLEATYTGRVEAYSLYAVKMFTVSVFESGCSVA